MSQHDPAAAALVGPQPDPSQFPPPAPSPRPPPSPRRRGRFVERMRRARRRLGAPAARAALTSEPARPSADPPPPSSPVAPANRTAEKPRRARRTPSLRPPLASPSWDPPGLDAALRQAGLGGPASPDVPEWARELPAMGALDSFDPTALGSLGGGPFGAGPMPDGPSAPGMGPTIGMDGEGGDAHPAPRDAPPASEAA